MWISKIFSAAAAAVDLPILCHKHLSSEFQFLQSLEEDSTKDEELYKVLLYVKIQALNPFLFLKPYSSKLLNNWATESGILPNDFISQDDLKVHKKTICLVNCIVSCSLTALTKVCLFCAEESGSPMEWFCNTADDKATWHDLNNCLQLKDALICVEKHKHIIKQIIKQIEVDEQIVATVFLITFMLRFEAFENTSFKAIVKEVDDRMLETDRCLIFYNLVPERFGQEMSEYSNTIKIYTMLLKASPYSVVAYFKRCEAFLALGMYLDAELDGIRLITLHPTFCKGYHKLASAFCFQGLFHSAHKVASVGQLNCRNPLKCIDFNLLKEDEEQWTAKCAVCCKQKESIEFSTKTDSNLVEKPKPIMSEAIDLPELTDPSNSEESSDEELPPSASDEIEIVKSNPSAKEDSVSSVSNERETVKAKSSRKEDSICDVPDLTDPSDAEGESDFDDGFSDVPDLTDPSDSEEESEIDENIPLPNVTEDKHKRHRLRATTSLKSPHKKEKRSKRYTQSVSSEKKSNLKQSTKKHERDKRKKANFSKMPMHISNTTEKLEHFNSLLKDGELAMKSGSAHNALHKFYQALVEQKSDPSLYNLDNWCVICLKYVYGSACCESGSFEDLNKAIGVFNDINSELDIRFPVATYGLGYAYFKLNRFKEALSYFKAVQSYLNNDISFPTLYWPGTKDIIEESCPENLKVVMENLITKCECPPSPLAACRYEHCLLTTEIYFSDPDFKGYYSIQCHDKCLLQYHPSCWKSIKDSLNRTDKDFLGQPCLTPDCEFIVTLVQCIGKDGSPKKCFMIDENEKTKKQKKSKLTKKMELKEMRKKRRQESNQIQIPASENNDICDIGDQNDGKLQNSGTVDEQFSTKEETTKNEVSNKMPVKKVESCLSVDAQPFYFRKKDLDADKKEVKQKDRKKPKKSTAVGVDEFCSKPDNFSLYNEYEKRLHILRENKRLVEDNNKTHWSTFCETTRNLELDPSRPFHIPEGLRKDPQALDEVLQSVNTMGETDVSRTLKESLFTYFEDILIRSGPMCLDDSQLHSEILEFPAESKKLIEKCGGLKKFLLQSMRFAVVADHICVIRDVVKAYSITSKFQNSGKLYPYDDCVYTYDRLTDIPSAEEEIISNGICNGFQSYLNPHASEYSPSISKQKRNFSSSISYPKPLNMQDVAETNVTNASVIPNNLQHDRRNGLEIAESPENLLNSTDDHHSLSNASGSNERIIEYSECVAELNGTDSNVQEQHSCDTLLSCETTGNNSLVFDSEKELKDVPSVVMQFYDDEKQASLSVLHNGLSKVNLQSVWDVPVSEPQNKNIQVDIPQTEMVSAGVIKNEGVDDIIANFLERENDLKLQLNKKEEEAVALRNELEKMKEMCTKAKNDHEAGKRSLEQSETKANERLKDLMEENKSLSDELKRKNHLLDKMEKTCEEVQIELKSEREAKCEVEASLKSAVESHEKIVSELKTKVLNTELCVVTFKKETILEKIDDATKNAHEKVKELEVGIQTSLSSFYVNEFKKLLSDLKEYIKQMKEIESKFLSCAEDHISAIQGGQVMDNLPSLTMPTLPKFPTIQPQCEKKFEPSAILDPLLPTAYYPQSPSVIQPSIVGFNPMFQTSYPKNVIHSSLYTEGYNFPGLNPPPNAQINGSFALVNQVPFNVSQRFAPKSSMIPAIPAPPGLRPNPRPQASIIPDPSRLAPHAPFPANVGNLSHSLVPNLPTQNTTLNISESDINSKSLGTGLISQNTVFTSASGNNPPVNAAESRTSNLFKSLSMIKEGEDATAMLKPVSPLFDTVSSADKPKELSFNTSLSLVTGTKPKSPVSGKGLVVDKNNCMDELVVCSDEDIKHAVVTPNLKSDRNETGACSPVSACDIEHASLSRHSSMSMLSLGEETRSQHKSQAKTSYEKLLLKLLGRFPSLSRGELMNYVTMFRQQHDNKLTGIPLENIVSGVALIIESRNPRIKHPKPKVLINKASLPPRDAKNPPLPAEKATECPWAKASGNNKTKWQGGPSEANCVVCFEPMNPSNSYSVDCGHRFHSKCIREWLKTKSSCPVCRVHILLLEDYPTLE